MKACWFCTWPQAQCSYDRAEDACGCWTCSFCGVECASAATAPELTARLDMQDAGALPRQVFIPKLCRRARQTCLEHQEVSGGPSGCKAKTAAAHGKSVAALLRATPLGWLAQGEDHRERLLGACLGSELMVSLFHAADGLQVAGLLVVA